jgi:hypothetical protein
MTQLDNRHLFGFRVPLVLHRPAPPAALEVTKRNRSLKVKGTNSANMLFSGRFSADRKLLSRRTSAVIAVR